MNSEPDASKRQLEEVLGKATPDAVARGFWYPASSYNFISNDSSYVTWKNHVAAFPKQCYPSNLLDVAGSGTTGSDGTATLLLSEFVCLAPLPGQYYSLALPVDVVATPYSADPFFLTLQHALVNNSTDVEIKILTWAADGSAAPEVSFDWRCRVAFIPGF
jgi:hypothetical protein